MSRWRRRCFHFSARLFTAGCRCGRGSVRDLDRVPQILSVGDLHVENFGTWRDSDGRLIWGINDFDEAAVYPYTMDLVRLATSAVLAPGKAAGNDVQRMLRTRFWRATCRGWRKAAFPLYSERTMCGCVQLPRASCVTRCCFGEKSIVFQRSEDRYPESAREAIEHLLPEPEDELPAGSKKSGIGQSGTAAGGRDRGLEGRARGAGGESSDRISAAMAECKARPGGDFVCRSLAALGAMPGSVCADARTLDRRRLSPSCSRIELEMLGTSRGELRLLRRHGERDGEYPSGDGRESAGQF